MRINFLSLLVEGPLIGIGLYKTGVYVEGLFVVGQKNPIHERHLFHHKPGGSHPPEKQLSKLLMNFNCSKQNLASFCLGYFFLPKFNSSLHNHGSGKWGPGRCV